MMEKFYYLGLMVITLIYPLLRSFEHRVQYHKQWYALFPAILITGSFFIIWDHWFTLEGVWSFNNRYLLGVFWLELPVEEWLFFIFVPFSCLFIYEVLNYFFKKDILKPFTQPITFILVPSFLFLGFYHLDKLYTGINFLMAGTMLLIHFVIFKKKYLGRFILAYLVSLVPFLIVNGILTGSWIEEPIVRYNDLENLSIRIGTIPVEDTVYAFTLLLMNLTIFEKIRSAKTIQTSQSY